MLKRFFRKFSPPPVTYATTVWEKDWRQILLDPEYLPIRQIQNHCFPFAEKLLIINNVVDLAAVKKAASRWIAEGVLSRFVIAAEIEDETLSFFQLKRSDFQAGADAHLYENVNPDWIYYNALGPLAAIYCCKSDYLLYLTGDVYLSEPLDWVGPALKKMESNPLYKVANPIWNGNDREARQESYRTDGAFYAAKSGFSDQIFLVKKEEFYKPIYGEIRPDSAHFPRGDVFEKRVFSYLKNRGLERIIFRRGSYIHENF
jgi:hypothetical protein